MGERFDHSSETATTGVFGSPYKTVPMKRESCLMSGLNRA
jgi:hypothetical protein